MIIQIFTGFDSAWTDNPKQPGAIASIVRYRNETIGWIEPKLATFREAEQEILHLAGQTPAHLVAIDQPTIVPNWGGSRPVDRVAGALISRLKGGVQPANRGKGKMFGDDAPIWKLLDAIPHIQVPWNMLPTDSTDVGCNSGVKVVMEVFPAVAIPGLMPSFYQRGIGAKYNPANQGKFNIDDWVAVCSGIGKYGADQNISELECWARKMAGIEKPIKSDQDKIDAAICAIVAYHWQTQPRGANLVIGDLTNGYLVTAVSPETRQILRDAADIRDVPCDQFWRGDSSIEGIHRRVQPTSEELVQETNPGDSAVKVKSRRIRKSSATHTPPVASLQGGKKLDQRSLRDFLVLRGTSGRMVTYGEVFEAFGKPCHEGTIGQLLRLLDLIALENRERGEPILAAIVVNKREGLPGKGFYKHVDVQQNTTKSTKHAVLAREFKRIKLYPWTEGGKDVPTQ